MGDAEIQNQPCSRPQTPDGQRLIPDMSGTFSTPRSIRTDAGDLASDEARKIVAENMNGETLVCDMPVFFKDYGASDVAPELISLCEADLRDQGLIIGESTWKDFQTSPSETKSIENDYYKPLESIVEAIFVFALGTGKRKNRFAFKMVPNDNLKADIPGTNHKMDACIFEVDDQEDDNKKRGPVLNHTVVVSFEGKKGVLQNDLVNVRRQLVGDCHHILCDDLRRMFIYGVTIVGEHMEAWYFSRSHSVKSEAFYWFSGAGIYTFIQLMLSFALATPEGLGIDPHVHKAPVFHHEKGQQYVYELDLPLSTGSGSHAAPPARTLRSHTKQEAKTAEAAKRCKEKRYFRTVSSLSPERPLCITGRVTRILAVREVASVQANQYLDKETVILKDVWINSEDRTEVESLEQIFCAIDQAVNDAEKKHPGPQSLKVFLDTSPQFKRFNEATKERLQNLLAKQNYRSLFLTALHTYDGKKTKPVSPEARTPESPVFAVGTKFGKPGSQSRTLQGSTNPAQRTMGTRSSPPSTPAHDRGPRVYVQKTQRRFIYKEVCVPSYKLPTFGDAMDIIRQTLDAIHLLYCAGWVHRDISAGNVLAMKVEENGKIYYKAKLSDFEFAQPVTTTTHRSDPRTGTPFFMPVEIMDGRYLLDTIRDYSGTQRTDPIGSFLSGVCALKPKKTRPENSATSSSPWGIQPDHPLFENLKQFKASQELLPVPPNATSDIPHDGAVVNYNYQHDLESIWWMIVYFVTTLAGHKPSHRLAQEWFTHDLNAAKREKFLRDAIRPTFGDALRREFQDVFPPIIESMREVLHDQYIARALYGLLKDNSAYSDIHAAFAQLLNGIMDSTQYTTSWALVEVRKIGSIPGVKVKPSAPSSRQAFKRTTDGDALRSQTAKKQRT